MATRSMQYCIALCVLVGIVYADYTAYGSCDSFSAESVNEGFCPHRYQDTLGIWTIGIGFNLEQSNAQTTLTNCGGDFAALNQGPNSCNYAGAASQTIGNSVAQCLLGTFLASAETCVKGVLGSQFSSVPTQVVSGMIDMAYNMGCAGLESFTTMISQIKSGQYSSAASDARSSKWCTQVGGRCTRTTACLQNTGGSSGGSTPPPPPPPPPAGGSSSGGSTCLTFESGMCPGASSCMCTLGSACPSLAANKLGVQSIHNQTEIIAARRREAIAQGKSGSCADVGGTCYTVIHGQCGGTSSCLAYGAQC